MKKTWSILKQIINKKKHTKSQTQFRLNDDCLTSDQSEISEKFNEFVVNVGPNLAEKIPTQTATPEHYLGSQLTNTIFLAPVTHTEIDEIVKSLKNCSSGYDEINRNILDISIPSIKPHLLYLLNQSLLQGVFPDE